MMTIIPYCPQMGRLPAAVLQKAPTISNQVATDSSSLQNGNTLPQTSSSDVLRQRGNSEWCSCVHSEEVTKNH